MSSVEDLEDLIGRLERAAEQLRSGELSADAAATLVEDCAALSRALSAVLDVEDRRLTSKRWIGAPDGAAMFRRREPKLVRR